MPTSEEQNVIAEEIFKQTGFPYIIGIIDGTHFELTKPTSNMFVINFIIEKNVFQNLLNQVYNVVVLGSEFTENSDYIDVAMHWTYPEVLTKILNPLVKIENSQVPGELNIWCISL